MISVQITLYYNVTCISLKNASDTSGKRCFNERCECDTTLLLPSNGRVVKYGGNVAPDVTTIRCDYLYQLSQPRLNATCGYDGKWHYSTTESVSCDLVVTYVIVIILCGCFALLVTCLLIMYKYRFDLKLYSYKYCSCCLCCCKCFRRFPESKKTYDTFISCHNSQRTFVDTTIYQPLVNGLYRAVVDYEHTRLIAGSNLFRDFAELINDSASLIAVVDQEFINRQWCMYEYEEALRCQLNDPTIQIIVILLLPLTDLENLPFWLKRTIEVHLYIEHNDPMLLGKLKQSLRNPTGCNADLLDDVMPDAQSAHASADTEEDESDEEYHQIQAQISQNHEESDQAALLLA